MAKFCMTGDTDEEGLELLLKVRRQLTTRRVGVVAKETDSEDEEHADRRSMRAAALDRATGEAII